MKRDSILLNSKTKEFMVVAFLLFVGIFIRAYHFGIIPCGVHQDEAMAAVDAKALLEYGTDRYGMRYPVHFTAWKTGQMSVLLSYFMVPFIKLFGFSVISVRLPMLVISCVGLLCLYFVGRRTGGTALGMLSLILGIICPWHYMQSRWSLDCNMFPHIFILGVCFLVFGLSRQWMLYVSMVFFGLCSYCYGIANYSVPLFLLVVAIFLVREKIVPFKKILLCVLVYFGVALPEYITLAINAFGGETISTPLFTMPFFPESGRAKNMLFINFSWEQMWKNIQTTISVLWLNGDSTIANSIPEFGPIYHFTNIFFFIGLFVAVGKIRKASESLEKMFYVILLAWFGMGIWIGIVTEEIIIHRINVIFYAMLLISAVGIKWCIDKCRILIIPIGIMYMVSALFFAYTYFRDWADDSRDFYYESYVDALYYAKDIPCDYYYISPDPQGAGIEEVGMIITMFCHEIDAEYYQGITNIQDGQLLLPYAERYNYLDVTKEIVEANVDKSVVYLIGREELEYFSQEEYNIASFYDWYFVVNKKE